MEYKKIANKKVLTIIGSGLIGLLAIWIILNLIPFSEVVARFKYAKFHHIFFYILASAGVLIFLTVRWFFILRSQGHKNIKFWELFCYKLVGYGVSFLTPAAKLGGEPVRALMLKKHGIKLKDGLSNVMIDKTIELSSYFLFFVVSSLMLIFAFPLTTKLKATLIPIIVLLIFLIGVFYYQMFNKGHFFLHIFRFLRLHRIKKIRNVEKTLEETEKLMSDFYKTRPKDFIIAVFLTAIAWGMSFVEFKLATLLLGHPEVSFSTLFLIFSGVGIAYLVPVPLALGSLEATQASIFHLIGLSTAAGVALAFLTRLRDLVITGIGLLYLAYFGINITKLAEKGFEPYYNENNVLIFDVKK